MKKLILNTALLAATLALPVSASAVLLGRDIAGNAVAGNDVNSVFLYDDVLNVTWLRQANANSARDWSQANTWASNLTVGSYGGWRLPTMISTPNTTFSYAGGTDFGQNVRTTSGSTVYSEMASLWYDTLGNKAYCNPVGSTAFSCNAQPGYGLTNTGDFQNLQDNFYWSGLEYAPNTHNAWSFNTNAGGQYNYDKADSQYALAVRPGDVLVAAVPEPETYALMLAGLALVGAAAKRKARRAH
jgi:hypothetical protein